MKNWKVIIGGLLTSAGIYLTQTGAGNQLLIGGVVTAVGALLLGWRALAAKG